MPILTEAEADALDELLTNTTPEVNPNVKGHGTYQCTMFCAQI